MLWDLVYDFFVKYIFGGWASDGNSYPSYFGYFTNGEYSDNFYGDTMGVKLSNFFDFGDFSSSTYFMPIGNYFSLIATIITMVAIVLICCALIKKIYNMCAHIIG